VSSTDAAARPGCDFSRLGKPALLYCGAIIYSTLVYFLIEFLSQRHRANLISSAASATTGVSHTEAARSPE
jgi:hypothetical protein